MIKVDKLTKTFDGVHALNELDLHVRKGSIYGLTGVNGSGKTTIIRHLSGMYRQDSGNVAIDDKPVYDNVEVKRMVGYIADDLFFFGNHSLNGLKTFYSGLYKSWDNSRYAELMGLFGLDPRRPTRKFSKGMQKQAAFILTMSTMPQVLLLDEPIDSLDPIIRNHVKQRIVEDVASREMTVLLSSHNLKEIEGICDTVGIIKNGRMVIQRDLDDLKSYAVKLQLAFNPDNPNTPAGPEKYAAIGVDIAHYEKHNHSSIETLIVRGAQDEIIARIKALNPIICDVLPLTLDEIFIYETEGADNDGKIIH